MVTRVKKTPLIPKGKMVFVHVVGRRVKDKKFFTVSAKLSSFLNLMAKEYPGKKVVMKEFNLN